MTSDQFSQLYYLLQLQQRNQQRQQNKWVKDFLHILPLLSPEENSLVLF